MSSWGFSITGAAEVVGDQLDGAAAAAFAELDAAVTVMRGRVREMTALGADSEAIARAQADADFTADSATSGREQAAAAIEAARVLLAKGHIDPCVVSITGEANPDHSADHEMGTPARVTVSITRA